MSILIKGMKMPRHCGECGIDFDGTDCPYIKPWGKQKYKHDHEPPKEE